MDAIPLDCEKRIIRNNLLPQVFLREVVAATVQIVYYLETKRVDGELTRNRNAKIRYAESSETSHGNHSTTEA